LAKVSVSKDAPGASLEVSSFKRRKKRMSSKIVRIDWKKVDKLLEKQCTEIEIAAHFNLHPDTVLKHCKKDHGMTFEEYAYKKRQKGCASLRSTLWKMAKTDSKVAIHLSKNYLGMSDKVHQEINTIEKVQIIDDIPLSGDGHDSNKTE
jgi:methylphosphotriester-DNA--protein-cysteine methyltransferase